MFHCGLSLARETTRSPSSALLPFFGGEGPLLIDYSKKKKKDTLILTSLLEDLDHAKGHEVQYGCLFTESSFPHFQVVDVI